MKKLSSFRKAFVLFAAILTGIAGLQAATITVSSSPVVAGVNYNTIQTAYDYIKTLSSSADITQPYIIEVQATYSAAGETYPIKIEGVAGASATNTITIKPAAGAKIVLANPAVSGTANKTIVFDGAGYVTIDGVSRQGDTGLTIQNPNVEAAHTVFFTVGSMKNTIKNCFIKGVSATKGSNTINNAVVCFDASAGNGNVIENNDICNVDGGFPVTMVLVANESASAADYQTIQNNKIYNYNYVDGVANGLPAAVHVAGATANVRILNNRIFWTGTIEPTKAAFYGIAFDATSVGAESRVEGNVIGGTDAENNGTASFNMTGEFRGISVNLNSTVKNNTVKNITFSTVSPNAYMIGIFSNGTALADVAAWSGNTITNIDMLYSTGNTTTNLFCMYIYPNATTPERNINNNTFSNIKHKSTPMVTTVLRGIQIATVSSSNFSNIPAAAWSYSGNSFYNLLCDETDNGTVTHGIVALDVHKNTSVVEKTMIYNLKNSNTVAKESILFGIRLNGSNTTGTTIKNNVISIGNGVAGSAQIRAIIQNVATTNNDPVNILNNTVYIAGAQNLTAANANAHSNAVYRDGNTTANLTIKNNIFLNERSSNQTTDIHVAIWSQVGHTQITTSDNNILIAPVCVRGGSTSFVGLADWRTASGNAKDISSVSVDPGFVAATAETPDFRIISTTSSAYQSGVFITAVADDFTGRTRVDNSGKTDIGAYLVGDFTAVKNPSESNLTVYGRTNAIVLENLNGKSAVVYSLNGSLLNSLNITSDKMELKAQRGLYLVRIDGRKIKVMVK